MLPASGPHQNGSIAEQSFVRWRHACNLACDGEDTGSEVQYYAIVPAPFGGLKTSKRYRDTYRRKHLVQAQAARKRRSVHNEQEVWWRSMRGSPLREDGEEVGYSVNVTPALGALQAGSNESRTLTTCLPSEIPDAARCPSGNDDTLSIDEAKKFQGNNSTTVSSRNGEPQHRTTGLRKRGTGLDKVMEKRASVHDDSEAWWRDDRDTRAFLLNALRKREE